MACVRRVWVGPVCISIIIIVRVAGQARRGLQTRGVRRAGLDHFPPLQAGSTAHTGSERQGLGDSMSGGGGGTGEHES
jgi:hypothetical protein